MIYLIGGAPRAGKSIFGQRLAAKLNIGWTSTDLLMELLRTKNVAGAPTEWDASAQAIRETANWFYPCLERFVWGVSSVAEHYLIEGVGFLPEHVVQLASDYPICAIFLGCSHMTLEKFDRFPGRSVGYAALPESLRRQIAYDVPLMSALIQQEAARFDVPYIDTGDDFSNALNHAEAIILNQ